MLVMQRRARLVFERRYIDEAVEHTTPWIEAGFQHAVTLGGKPVTQGLNVLALEQDGRSVIDRRAVIVKVELRRVDRDAAG